MVVERASSSRKSIEHADERRDRKWILVARAFLFAHLLVFFGYAVAFIGWPTVIGSRLGIELQSITALADFRAMYGGMCLGVGVLFVLGLRSDRWLGPALLTAVLTAAGLLIGRMWTLAVDGPPGPLIYGFMGVEVGAILTGVLLMRRVSQ